LRKMLTRLVVRNPLHDLRCAIARGFQTTNGW